MKAIIIEEHHFAEITEKLRLKALDVRVNKPPLMSEEVRAYISALPEGTWECVVQDIHRAFHCEFVRWAQSHGASCVR